MGDQYDQYIWGSRVQRGAVTGEDADRGSWRFGEGV